MGARAQGYARQVLEEFRGQLSGCTLDENVKVGQNIIDFVVKYGGRVAQIEVKWGLPRKVGDSMTRLINQVSSMINYGEGQPVVWTLQKPTNAQRKLVMEALGENASKVKFVDGVEGLMDWFILYFKL